MRSMVRNVFALVFLIEAGVVNTEINYNTSHTMVTLAVSTKHIWTVFSTNASFKGSGLSKTGWLIISVEDEIALN